MAADAIEDVTDEELAEFYMPFYRAPIGWLFYTTLAIIVGLLMWSVSGPGTRPFLFLGSAAAVAVLGFAWLFRAPTYFGAGGRQIRTFVVTPLIVAVAILLALGPWPARARFAASRPAFDRLAAQVASGQRASAPGVVGLYKVGSVQGVPGGWIVYDSNGNGFDDAGFAYLPGGPTGDLGNGYWEDPQFRHLTGPWYSWTASW